jgi:hypothetical protein
MGQHRDRTLELNLRKISVHLRLSLFAVFFLRSLRSFAAVPIACLLFAVFASLREIGVLVSALPT